MSAITPNEQPEFDFWEFVACARCHLPFSAESGAQPPVPFWVTECGHVVCNNHLKPDQSCTECGTQGIQVAPLQREMDAPMSEWFRSVPQAIDTLAYATRFQIETLASCVRYYKHKCSQQRMFLERAKATSQENKLLRKRVEELQIEIQQSRESQHHQYEPSEARNANGKRRMTDAHHPNNGIRSFSSPRSVTTPLGPDRLTLPPKHSRPPSHAQQHVNSDDSIYHHSQSRQVDMQNMSNERPGSSRFAKQFSYNPPPTQLMDPNHVPDMSRNPTHSSRPATFLNSSNSNHNPRLGSVPPPSAKKMPPPPPPRVAKAPPQLERSHLTNNLQPQQIFSTGPTSLRTQSFSDAPRSNRFLPSSRNNHLVQNEQAIKTHQGPSAPSSNHFVIPPTPQLGSRTASLARGWNGGQRHPFMPKSG